MNTFLTIFAILWCIGGIILIGGLFYEKARNKTKQEGGKRIDLVLRWLTYVLSATLYILILIVLQNLFKTEEDSFVEGVVYVISLLVALGFYYFLDKLRKWLKKDLK